MQNHTRAIVFVGPSALGKTYAAETLTHQHPEEFIQARLHTTRPPRGTDDKAVDRIFINAPTFQDMVESGRFLVHGEFGGNHYGFTNQTLIPSDKHILVNIWPALVPEVAKLSSRPVFVGFQAPKDWKELLTTRMKQRGDTEETINKRLALIENDIKITAQYQELISANGKLFVIKDDQTIPQEVIPWIRQKLGLPEPR